MFTPSTTSPPENSSGRARRLSAAGLIVFFSLMLVHPGALQALPPHERLVVKPGSEHFLRATFQVIDVAVDFSPSEQTEQKKGSLDSSREGKALGNTGEKASNSTASKAGSERSEKARELEDSKGVPASKGPKGSAGREHKSLTDTPAALPPPGGTVHQRTSGDSKRPSPTLKPSTGAVSPDGLEHKIEVELLPAEEILLSISDDSPAGQALVLAIGNDRVKAFEVCISRDGGRDCPRPQPLDGAQKVCSSLKTTLDEGSPITSGTIESVECLDALKAALAHSDQPPSSFRFILDEAPATVFFQRVLDRIRRDPATRGLEASYYGATLSLRGKVSRAAIRRALIHAYRETVGNISYDDQTTRP